MAQANDTDANNYFIINDAQLAGTPAASALAPTWASCCIGDPVTKDDGTDGTLWNDEKNGAYALPGVDGGIAPVFAGGSNIGISAASQNQEGARELLRIIFSEEYQNLLGANGLIAYTPVGPLVPALKSYWFLIHVTTIILASGILLLGAVPAALFLIKNGYDQGRRGFPFTLGRRAPAAETLERLTFRLHAFAFPLFTFGALIAGPLWAEASWGRYWGWDPKEVWAFISWIVYAGYLHARATPSVKRTTATWIALIGFATMLMNLFGVNLFFEGLHSYANAG